jgi:hypothetical protein
MWKLTSRWDRLWVAERIDCRIRLKTQSQHLKMLNIRMSIECTLMRLIFVKNSSEQRSIVSGPIADLSIVCQAFYINQKCFSIDNYWSQSCSPSVIITNVMMFSLIRLFSTLQIDDFLMENLNVEISEIYVDEGRGFHRLAHFRLMLITAFFRLNRALSDWSSLWMCDCPQTNGNPIERIFASRLADQRGWLRCAQEISRMVIWGKIPFWLNIKT